MKSDYKNINNYCRQYGFIKDAIIEHKIFKQITAEKEFLDIDNYLTNYDTDVDIYDINTGLSNNRVYLLNERFDINSIRFKNNKLNLLLSLIIVDCGSSTYYSSISYSVKEDRWRDINSKQNIHEFFENKINLLKLFSYLYNGICAELKEEFGCTTIKSFVNKYKNNFNSTTVMEFKQNTESLLITDNDRKILKYIYLIKEYQSQLFFAFLNVFLCINSLEYVKNKTLDKYLFLFDDFATNTELFIFNYNNQYINNTLISFANMQLTSLKNSASLKYNNEEIKYFNTYIGIFNKIQVSDSLSRMMPVSMSPLNANNNTSIDDYIVNNSADLKAAAIELRKTSGKMEALYPFIKQFINEKIVKNNKVRDKTFRETKRSKIFDFLITYLTYTNSEVLNYDEHFTVRRCESMNNFKQFFTDTAEYFLDPYVMLYLYYSSTIMGNYKRTDKREGFKKLFEIMLNISSTDVVEYDKYFDFIKNYLIEMKKDVKIQTVSQGLDINKYLTYNNLQRMLTYGDDDVLSNLSSLIENDSNFYNKFVELLNSSELDNNDRIFLLLMFNKTSKIIKNSTGINFDSMECIDDTYFKNYNIVMKLVYTFLEDAFKNHLISRTVDLYWGDPYDFNVLYNSIGFGSLIKFITNENESFNDYLSTTVKNRESVANYTFNNNLGARRNETRSKYLLLSLQIAVSAIFKSINIFKENKILTEENASLLSNCIKKKISNITINILPSTEVLNLNNNIFSSKEDFKQVIEYLCEDSDDLNFNNEGDTIYNMHLQDSEIEFIPMLDITLFNVYANLFNLSKEYSLGFVFNKYIKPLVLINEISQCVLVNNRSEEKELQNGKTRNSSFRSRNFRDALSSLSKEISEGSKIFIETLKNLDKETFNFFKPLFIDDFVENSIEVGNTLSLIETTMCNITLHDSYDRYLPLLYLYTDKTIINRIKEYTNNNLDRSLSKEDLSKSVKNNIGKLVYYTIFDFYKEIYDSFENKGFINNEEKNIVLDTLKSIYNEVICASLIN